MNIYVEKEALIPIHENLRFDITSVFIYHSKDGVLKNFRCNNCGKLLFQYEGRIGTIKDDGSVPSEKNYKDISCHRCKVIYRIVDV